MRFVLAVLLLAGCCVDYVSPTDTDNGPVDLGSGSAASVPLISGDWTLQPDSENYVCVRKTITEDTYIKTILPIAPPGTHHFVLMVGAPDAPAGITSCDSSLSKPAIFASGVGVQPLAMPDGIAIHIAAGQQLLLNLHLFNASDTILTGTSGIAIESSPPVDTAHSAGVILAGKTIGLTVATGVTTQDATCTTTASGKYHVTCTYANYSGATVKFGESTEDEMCFAITFAYPAPAQKTCGI